MMACPRPEPHPIAPRDRRRDTGRNRCRSRARRPSLSTRGRFHRGRNIHRCTASAPRDTNIRTTGPGTNYGRLSSTRRTGKNPPSAPRDRRTGTQSRDRIVLAGRTNNPRAYTGPMRRTGRPCASRERGSCRGRPARSRSSRAASAPRDTRTGTKRPARKLLAARLDSVRSFRNAGRRPDPPGFLVAHRGERRRGTRKGTNRTRDTGN